MKKLLVKLSVIAMITLAAKFLFAEITSGHIPIASHRHTNGGICWGYAQGRAFGKESGDSECDPVNTYLDKIDTTYFPFVQDSSLVGISPGDIVVFGEVRSGLNGHAALVVSVPNPLIKDSIVVDQVPNAANPPAQEQKGLKVGYVRIIQGQGSPVGYHRGRGNGGGANTYQLTFKNSFNDGIIDVDTNKFGVWYERSSGFSKSYYHNYRFPIYAVNRQNIVDTTNEQYYYRVYQGWADDGEAPNPRSIQVTSNAVYEATFLKEFNLTLQTATHLESGSGGTYLVNGSNVGSTWSGTMMEGGEDNLGASPPQGSCFIIWNNGSVSNPYYPADHTTLSARYKAHLGSNVSTVLQNPGARKLVFDGTDDYTLTYESAGEIWSTTNWGNETRLSLGNGSNSLPAATTKGGPIFTTWQRNTGGSNYTVYYHSNTSGNWGFTPVEAGTVSDFTPRPVIGQHAKLDNGYHLSTILAWQQSSNVVRVKGTLQNTSAWQYDDSLTFASGLDGITLSTLETEDDNSVLTLGYVRDFAIRSRDFPAAGVQWESEIDVPASSWVPFWYDEWGSHDLTLSIPFSPQIIRYGGRTEYCWGEQQEYDEGMFVHNYRVYQSRDEENNWSSAAAFETVEYGPATLSRIDWDKTVLMWSDEGVVFESENLGSPSYVADGNDPQLSVYGGAPASEASYVYSYPASPLTQIIPASSVLTKSAGPRTTERIYGRSITVVDTAASSSFSVILSDVRIGDRQIPLKGVVDSLPGLTGVNWTSFLETEPGIIGAKDDTLSFALSVSTRGSDAPLTIAVAADVMNGSSDALISRVATVTHERGKSSSVAVKVPLQALRRENIRLRLMPSGSLADASSQFILTHIYSLPSSRLSKGGSKTVTAKLPTATGLLGSYPNPFNPTTAVRYELSAASHVNLRVFDMLGREVATLVNGPKEMGTHTATFNGQGLASGMYVARLTVTDEVGRQTVRSIKMELVR